METKALLVALAAILPIIVPLALLIWWKIKTKTRVGVFIIGSICFIVFAMGLEQILHRYCLMGGNAVSNAINGNIFLYALYAAFAAGIFEETARLFAYKCLLKKYKDPAISVGYGIGHGGIEMFITLGLTYIIYFIFLNGFSFADEVTNAQIYSLVYSIPNSTILVAIAERFIALTLHIALSIIVFKAVNSKEYKWFVIAVLLHVITDIPAAFYQTGSLSLAFVEIWSLAVAVIALIIGIKFYKQMRPVYLERKEARKYIAFCGKDCEACPDEVCSGCRVDGPKSDFCENYCEMRRCGLDKHIETCEDCSDKKRCGAFAQAQELLKNLKEKELAERDD